MNSNEIEKLKKLDDFILGEIERLNNLEKEDSDYIKLEVQRSNAMALAGKTLIQSVAIKSMADKKREEFKEKLTTKLLQ
jgi:hypothetical protein